MAQYLKSTFTLLHILSHKVILLRIRTRHSKNFNPVNLVEFNTNRERNSLIVFYQRRKYIMLFFFSRITSLPFDVIFHLIFLSRSVGKRDAIKMRKEWKIGRDFRDRRLQAIRVNRLIETVICNGKPLHGKNIVEITINKCQSASHRAVC